METYVRRAPSLAFEAKPTTTFFMYRFSHIEKAQRSDYVGKNDLLCEETANLGALVDGKCNFGFIFISLW